MDVMSGRVEEFLMPAELRPTRLSAIAVFRQMKIDSLVTIA